MLHIEDIVAPSERYGASVGINEWTSRADLLIIGVTGLGQDFNSIKDPTGELIRTYRKLFSPSPRTRPIGLLSCLLPTWLMQNLP